jgi:hypothetical protein
MSTGYGWYRVETGNFQTVVPGHIYRSGQQGRKPWRAYLQHYGIKSLLNLRGAHTAARWYLLSPYMSSLTLQKLAACLVCVC